MVEEGVQGSEFRFQGSRKVFRVRGSEFRIMKPTILRVSR
jgi:hypothetical protein